MFPNDKTIQYSEENAYKESECIVFEAPSYTALPHQKEVMTIYVF